MKPANPAKVRERILYYAGLSTPSEFKDGWKKALIGQLGRACYEKDHYGQVRTDLNRYLVLGVILTPDGQRFCPVNTKWLWPQAWNALKKWIDPTYQELTGKWHPRAEFKAECGMVLTFAKWAYGQLAYYLSPKDEPTIDVFLAAWDDYVVDAEIEKDGPVAEELKYAGAVITGRGPEAKPKVRLVFDSNEPVDLTAEQVAYIDKMQKQHEELLRQNPPTRRRRRTVRPLEPDQDIPGVAF